MNTSHSIKEKTFLKECQSVNNIVEKDNLLSSIFNNNNIGICITDDSDSFPEWQ